MFSRSITLPSWHHAAIGDEIAVHPSIEFERIIDTKHDAQISPSKVVALFSSQCYASHFVTQYSYAGCGTRCET